MSHFAALVAGDVEGGAGQRSWKSSEVELGGVDDIEDVADLMRDAAIGDGPVLLFVEEDDEWFAIVRVDGAGEPRVFISDARVVAVSELAAVLFEDEITDDVADQAEADAEDEDIVADDDERPSARPDPEPAGATDVLADLGIAASALLDMCAEEGALPADVIAGICDQLGCAEEIEVYR